MQTQLGLLSKQNVTVRRTDRIIVESEHINNCLRRMPSETTEQKKKEKKKRGPMNRSRESSKSTKLTL